MNEFCLQVLSESCNCVCLQCVSPGKRSQVWRRTVCRGRRCRTAAGRSRDVLVYKTWASPRAPAARPGPTGTSACVVRRRTTNNCTYWPFNLSWMNNKQSFHQQSVRSDVHWLFSCAGLGQWFTTFPRMPFIIIIIMKFKLCFEWKT